MAKAEVTARAAVTVWAGVGKKVAAAVGVVAGALVMAYE
jgi:outer membrane lipoprotein SlyB